MPYWSAKLNHSHSSIFTSLHLYTTASILEDWVRVGCISMLFIFYRLLVVVFKWPTLELLLTPRLALFSIIFDFISVSYSFERFCFCMYRRTLVFSTVSSCCEVSFLLSFFFCSMVVRLLAYIFTIPKILNGAHSLSPRVYMCVQKHIVKCEIYLLASVLFSQTGAKQLTYIYRKFGFISVFALRRHCNAKLIVYRPNPHLMLE